MTPGLIQTYRPPTGIQSGGLMGAYVSPGGPLAGDMAGAVPPAGVAGGTAPAGAAGVVLPASPSNGAQQPFIPIDLLRWISAILQQYQQPQPQLDQRVSTTAGVRG